MTILSHKNGHLSSTTSCMADFPGLYKRSTIFKPHVYKNNSHLVPNNLTAITIPGLTMMHLNEDRFKALVHMRLLQA